MSTVRSKKTPTDLNRYAKSLKELIDSAKSSGDWSSLDKLESSVGYLQDLIDYYRLNSNQPISHYSHNFE